MTLSLQGNPLSPDDLAQARMLWDALLFASSLEMLEAARWQLKAAPPRVQEAVMNALVPLVAHNVTPQRNENPFGSGA